MRINICLEFGERRGVKGFSKLSLLFKKIMNLSKNIQYTTKIIIVYKVKNQMNSLNFLTISV